jgi:hypothetical protein
MKPTNEVSQNAGLKWIEKNGRWGYETSEGNFVELVTRQEKNPVAFRTSLKVLEEILEGAPNLKTDAENGLISFTVSGGKIHLHYSEAWHKKQDALFLESMSAYLGDGVTVSPSKPIAGLGNSIFQKASDQIKNDRSYEEQRLNRSAYGRNSPPADKRPGPA